MLTHRIRAAGTCALLCMLPTLAAAVDLPAGARIGVVNMTTSDVMHFHSARTANGAFMKTYRVTWPQESQFTQPISTHIERAGFVPVILKPPDPLRRNREKWFVSNTRSTRFGRDCFEQLQLLAAAEQLAAVIIAVPGTNDSPQAVEGNRLRALPEYVQGWGFSTQEAGGDGNPVIFNLTQLLLFDTSGEEVRFQHREWGGSYVYQWTTFTAPPDLKQIPAEEIDKLQPLFVDIVSRQIGRLFEQIQVAGTSAAR